MAIAVLTIACAGPAAAHAAAPGDTLGAYPGAGNLARLGSFEQRLGRNVSRGHDYLNKSSWNAMLDVRWMAERWTSAGYAKKMVITVPMLPDTVASGHGPLASGAAGD
ncbi:MAG: hypothetical protein M3401_02820, partial [Actinomycetota bacterium]|nr:hypothetical protein [Actinomycetota bacterium]